MRRILTKLYVVLTGTYGLSMTGLLLLRAVRGESRKIVALFNSYLHLMLMPSLIFLPLSLLLKRPRDPESNFAISAVWRGSIGQGERMLIGQLLQEPPRITRFDEAHFVFQAEPSTGAVE